MSDDSVHIIQIVPVETNVLESELKNATDYFTDAMGKMEVEFTKLSADIAERAEKEKKELQKNLAQDKKALEKELAKKKKDLDKELANQKKAFEKDKKKLEKALAKKTKSIEDSIINIVDTANEQGAGPSTMDRIWDAYVSLTGRSADINTSSGSTSEDQDGPSVHHLIQSPITREVGDKKLLKVRFKLSQFDIADVVLKTVDNKLVVSASHDGNQGTSRTFGREFTLPPGINQETIQSSMSKDGVLTVELSLI